MPPYSLALRAKFTRNLTGQLKRRLHAKSKQFWEKMTSPCPLAPQYNLHCTSTLQDVLWVPKPLEA